MLYKIGGVRPFSRDSKDKENFAMLDHSLRNSKDKEAFAMLDEIRMTNKENL
jgi:hypothetical protein